MGEAERDWQGEAEAEAEVADAESKAEELARDGVEGTEG